jgi:hypothetical protein
MGGARVAATGACAFVPCEAAEERDAEAVTGIVAQPAAKKTARRMARDRRPLTAFERPVRGQEMGSLLDTELS